MVAPTPVSALLHAVAVVKAGVFTVLKVVVYIFGIDLLAETGASDWLMFVAAFTLLTASLVALTKDNLKSRLAYSTVSQLSRSEEHTSELQSLMRISYSVFCLKKKKKQIKTR